MEITEIRKRRSSLVAVFCGDEILCIVDRAIADENGIRVGKELSYGEAQELTRQSDMYRAKQKAFRMIAMRDYSRSELIKKIAPCSSEEAALGAADRMTELGLINDDRYAQDLAHRMLFVKLYSAEKTKYELLKKGIDREKVCEIIEELSPDPHRQLCALIEKKYADRLSDDSSKRKVYSALLRLGYRGGDIMRAMREYADEIEVEE